MYMCIDFVTDSTILRLDFVTDLTVHSIVCCSVYFNNILVLSLQSVLFVGKSKQRVKSADLAQITDKVYHMKLYRANVEMIENRIDQQLWWGDALIA